MSAQAMKDAYIVRLEPEEAAKVERFIKRLADTSKANVSRSGALRALILKGLEAEEKHARR